MYLGPHAGAFTPARRIMDDATREAKVGEIWRQLTWLESAVDSHGPWMAGVSISAADCTWFPTACFMVRLDFYIRKLRVPYVD